MNDAKYIFVQDVKNKKQTGRSSRNRKTHGGAVKLPSDYMTKKELNAMNGETTTYRLNEPLTWKEFRKMPDDIKVMYITALREKYDVPDSYIAQMMHINRPDFSKEMARLNLRCGKRGKHTWAMEEFMAWSRQGKCADEQDDKPIVEPIKPEIATKHYPKEGLLNFEGDVNDALEIIRNLLGGANIKFSIAWHTPAKGKNNG